MRFCDLLRHFAGDIIFKLYQDGKMFREDSLNNLAKECKESFNIFSGFDCELWEMKVKSWAVTNNIVYVELHK